MFFFYKHNAYKHIQPRISEKNKHMLSILSSLENSCSLLFSCLKSHSEAYSESHQTSKMKFLLKIVNDFQPLNIFYKKTSSQLFERVLITPLSFLVKLQACSLQSTTLLKDGHLHRYFSRILATQQEHLFEETPLDGCFKRDRCYKKCCQSL